MSEKVRLMTFLTSTNMMATKTRLQESAAQQSTAEQQSDNVAHALAGAGGGLLSMALTLV